MSGLDLAVGAACVLGIVGAVVQIVPGLAIVAGAVAVWGVVTGGAAGWTMFAVALATFVLASVGKYYLAGRRLRAGGVAPRSMLVGGALAVVGFFLIPVVGAVIGFVCGVYLVEGLHHRSASRAWAATRKAIASVGLAILVELFAALALSVAWLIVILTT